MEVVISDAVFDKVPTYQILSDVQRGLKQRHRILPENMASASYSSWLSSCAELLKQPEAVQLLEKQIAQSIFVSSRRKFRVLPDSAKLDRTVGEVNYSEFSTTLLRTFRIYVENGRADKKFLLAILDPKLRLDIEELVFIGAINFETCGGIGELKKKLEHDAANIDLLHLHSFALFDSDAPAPSVYSKDAVAALETCFNLKVPSHCLGRRAIENYLPIESIEDFALADGSANGKGRIHMARILRLISRDQFAHLHLKHGLSDELAKSQLYAALPLDIKQRLNVGFGDDLSSCYSEPAAITRSRFAAANLTAEIDVISREIMEVL